MRMFYENEMSILGPAIAPLANGLTATGAGDPNIRWLQSALNQLMNAGLAVDGVPGPATRAAVRNFQMTKGLVADGIAGPVTIAALQAALAGSDGAQPATRPVCTGLPERQTLDHFAFGSHRLEPHHMLRIEAIAACLLASLDTSTPIDGLTLTGHTDPVGDDVANVALGQKRADAVADAIDASLRRQSNGRHFSFVFVPMSAGERQPLPGDPALSRRVDILAPFAFPPPPKPKPGKTRPPKVDPPQLSRLDPPRWGPILSRAMGPRGALRTGNAVRHLIDAENTANPALATYPAMIDAIKAVQGSDSFIYLLGWICIDQFDMINCDASTKFEKLLADAASGGTQVRALLWDQVDPIANAQNQNTIKRINKLPGGAAILDGRTLSLGSHHQKMLVVGDAEQLVAFTGGIDINPDRVLPSLIVCPPPSPRPRPTGTEVETNEDDESSSGGGGKPLHDVHCRIEGPSAFDMLSTFIMRWDHHPDSRPIEARTPLRGRSRRIPGAVPGPLSPTQSATGGTCSVVTARTFNPMRGSALPRERDIKALLLAAISNARRFIYMEEQYLLNLDAAAALRAALPQIEHLTIVIGASDISDLPCVWTYRRAFIDALTRGLAPELAAKVRVFQLATPPLPGVPPACATKRKTFTPVFGRHTYVHAKCWVFDDELAVIGSANCNKRGWEHDSELNAFIFDDRRPPASAHSFAQQFRMDAWAEHLNVPPARVEDGLASAALWLRPGARAKVLPYCPDDDDDAALMPCSISRSVIDPSAP